MAAHAALNGPRIRAYKYAGPDFVEGPHTTLSEEEFFDALEMAYKSEEDREGEVSSKRSNVATETPKERERKEASLDKNSQNPTKSESGQEDVSTEHQVLSSICGTIVSIQQATLKLLILFRVFFLLLPDGGGCGFFVSGGGPGLVPRGDHTQVSHWSHAQTDPSG